MSQRNCVLKPDLDRAGAENCNRVARIRAVHKMHAHPRAGLGCLTSACSSRPRVLVLWRRASLFGPTPCPWQLVFTTMSSMPSKRAPRCVRCCTIMSAKAAKRLHPPLWRRRRADSAPLRSALTEAPGRLPQHLSHTRWDALLRYRKECLLPHVADRYLYPVYAGGQSVCRYFDVVCSGMGSERAVSVHRLSQGVEDS